MAARGEPIFEYVPLAMSPMTVASLLLLVIVTFVVGPFLAPPEFWPLGGLCLAPLGLAVGYAILQRPSPTRIYAEGIEVSRPLWRRLAGGDGFHAWSDVRNLYPASYEIAGAAMSPFASSAGTLVHRGLGLELVDGRRLTVKFTPGSIRAFRADSEGFRYALMAAREALKAIGRRPVSEVRSYTDDDVRAMHEEARRPLLGMGTIVLAFFLPPTLVAALLLLLASLSIPLTLLPLVLALLLAVAPPLASMARTLRKSRRRNELLSELAKHEEFLRQDA